MKKIVFMLAVLAAAALGDGYVCTINDIVIADKPSKAAEELYRKNFINKTFTVDRNTGIMSGALKNSYVTFPQIIDRGGKDNSFKAVTTMKKEQGLGAGSNVYTLVIDEYVFSFLLSFTTINATK